MSETIGEARAERDGECGPCSSLLDRSAGDVRPRRSYRFADGERSSGVDDPPSDDEIRRAGQPTREEWDSWTPDRRQRWAREYAASRGTLTARERQEFERQARNADYAFVTGIVREGFSTLRTYITESQETERERIRASAQRQGNTRADDRDAEQSLLDDAPTGGDQGVTPPPPAAAPVRRAKSSSSAAIPLVAAALMFLR